MLDHNIDNFTSQTGTDYSSSNYVVDKNIILGLICLADVMCVDVSVLILTRCLNPCSFVSKNIWKMRIKFAKIPHDLLIMGCWVRGEDRGGEGIKNTAIIWSPPLTKYSVILARHPRYTGDLYRVIMTGNNLLRTSVTANLLQPSLFNILSLLSLSQVYLGIWTSALLKCKNPLGISLSIESLWWISPEDVRVRRLKKLDQPGTGHNSHRRVQI